MHPTFRWLLLPLFVAFAWLAGLVTGALSAASLDLWTVPVAGFTSAVAVVLVAYVAAPSKRLVTATAALAFGAICAWYGWGNSWYPEHYERAYQPTRVPLFMTILGGCLAWAVCCVHRLRSHRAPDASSTSGACVSA